MNRLVISCTTFLILCLLAIPLSSFQTDTQPQYLQIRLKKNMTIDELLKSYSLADYPCNLPQFLKINRLQKALNLKDKGVYMLPILIYNYNGKNIRSSTGISDLKIAKAIQSYNEKLVVMGKTTQSYKQSGFLYAPFHAINCLGSRKPSVPKIETEENLASVEPNSVTQTRSGQMKEAAGFKTIRYDIFGKNYQNVPIQSRKLKGKIFYVEAGHGGPDPGAQTKLNGRTLCEDEYAYDVSLRVARELIKQGGTVYLINRDNNDGIRDGDFLLCDRDEVTIPDLKIPVNHKARLFQRSDAVNDLYEKFAKKGIKDQRLIVIHVDSRGKREQTDTFLYFQSGSEESKKLAKKMQTVLQTEYNKRRPADNKYEGTVSTRDLHMLRETKPTTVFVEIGNIRNEFDRKRIMVKNNRQAVAQWLAQGFMQ